MYEKYWGLTEKPFRNTPDPRFLYCSKQHEEALVRMLYCVSEAKGAMLLTGDYGCGKTLLSRAFISELDRNKYTLALITNPNLTSEEFLKETLYQFGLDTDLEKKLELLHLLNDFVFEQKRLGRAAVILVDEAQAVTDPSTLEEIRLLLNFQRNDEFLITLILMGQPELKSSVAALPQLKQRLSVRYHLGPLSKEDTERYVKHRLEVAGAQKEIFAPSALDLLTQTSRGIPREVNNICDLALLVGYGKKADGISAELMTEVINDMENV